MEPTQINKAPLPVIVLSWLMLLAGILGLLGGSFLSVLLFGFSSALAIVLLIGIAIDIGLIIVSFGLRKMKRWAYISFAVITALSIIGWLLNSLDSGLLIGALINVIVLVYLWTLRKRFV